MAKTTHKTNCLKLNRKKENRHAQAKVVVLSHHAREEGNSQSVLKQKQPCTAHTNVNACLKLGEGKKSSQVRKLLQGKGRKR